MKSTVDLNSDLGEGAGFDDELLSLVSSANIACGFHAGDADTMKATMSAAAARNVAIGAHPSLFDRENFGRTELPVTPAQVFDAVAYQLGIFQAVAEALGVKVRHLKPHGALYNMAARDASLAEAIVRAMADADPLLLLYAPDRSALTRAGREGGIRVVAEVFADRNYLNDGSLVPRSRPDALLEDAEAAAIRVVNMLRNGTVQSVDGQTVTITAETVCVHGDTPGAVNFARLLREHLQKAGMEICAPAQRME
jgi:UPF0271 protein